MARRAQQGEGRGDVPQPPPEGLRRGRATAGAVIARIAMVAALMWTAHMAQPAHGHEVRPAYLEMQQATPQTWSVLWKVPAQGDMRLSIHPRFPPSCALASEPIAYLANGA